MLEVSAWGFGFLEFYAAPDSRPRNLRATASPSPKTESGQEGRLSTLKESL